MNIAPGIDAPNAMIGATVHVDDVALIHVLAIDEEKVAVKQRERDGVKVRDFIASASSVDRSEVNEMIRHDEEFKDAVESGVLKLGKDENEEGGI